MDDTQIDLFGKKAVKKNRIEKKRYYFCKECGWQFSSNEIDYKNAKCSNCGSLKIQGVDNWRC